MVKWNDDKYRQLLLVRGIDLAKVAEIINQGCEDIVPVNNQDGHPGQLMFVIDYDGYAVCVPFVKEPNGDIFLKTAFRSRKYNKGKEV